MSIKTYKDESRKDWGTDQNAEINRDQIQLGAILRIADASEKMASNYTQLQNDLDWYKKRYREAQETVAKRDRQIANLRGQITKLKKKIQ